MEIFSGESIQGDDGMMDGQGRSDRFSKEIPPPMREISFISTINCTPTLF